MIDFQGYNHNNSFCRTVLSEVKASAEQAQLDLPSDDYIICSKLVPGFALPRKRWFWFDIDLVEEIVFNTAAFENLVLEPERKWVLSSLVQSQMKSTTREFDSIIPGKGRGLIILLHGPPGVGKTLTAGKITCYLPWMPQ